VQNNPDNCQSHEQFDQAETALMHDISLPEVFSAEQSMRGRWQCNRDLAVACSGEQQQV
jgi:hypothetical protein